LSREYAASIACRSPHRGRARYTIAAVSEDTSVLTVPDAARELRESFSRVMQHKARYEQIRGRSDLRSVDRARNELAIATFGFVGDVVAMAEAKDRRDPVWAEETGRHLRMFRSIDPSHVQCERAWRDYQAARKAGYMVPIEAARDAWRRALVNWAEQLYKSREAEDHQDAHVEVPRWRRPAFSA